MGNNQFAILMRGCRHRVKPQDVCYELDIIRSLVDPSLHKAFSLVGPG